MNKDIKLLIFAKTADGGPGTFLLSMQKLPYYLNKKLDVKIIVLKKPVYRDLNKNGFTYYKNDSKLYTSKYNFNLLFIKQFTEEFMWFSKKIKRYKPEIVLSLDAHCNLISILYKIIFFSKAKLMITTHINVIDTVRAKSSNITSKIILLLISILYKYADSLICISKNTTRSFRKDLRITKKIKTIYYGLTFPVPTIKEKKNKQKIILSIGRLDEQKDFETLIYAFGLVFKKNKNIKLLIAGDGPLKRKLSKLIIKLKLERSIKLVGWQKNIYPLINKSDLFVLSTKREGFGYVLIEAMSQKVPVISTDAPFGPSEILNKGEFGILVKMADSKELAQKIEEILFDNKLYELYAQKAYLRSKFFEEGKMLKSYAYEIKKVMNI